MIGVVSGSTHQRMQPPRSLTPRMVGAQLSCTTAPPGCMKAWFSDWMMPPHMGACRAASSICATWRPISRRTSAISGRRISSAAPSRATRRANACSRPRQRRRSSARTRRCMRKASASRCWIATGRRARSRISWSGRTSPAISAPRPTIIRRSPRAASFRSILFRRARAIRQAAPSTSPSFRFPPRRRCRQSPSPPS